MSADKRNKGQGPRLRTRTHPTQAHTGPVMGTSRPGPGLLGPWGHVGTAAHDSVQDRPAVAGSLSMCVSIWDEEG